LDSANAFVPLSSTSPGCRGVRRLAGLPPRSCMTCSRGKHTLLRILTIKRPLDNDAFVLTIPSSPGHTRPPRSLLPSVRKILYIGSGTSRDNGRGHGGCNLFLFFRLTNYSRLLLFLFLVKERREERGERREERGERREEEERKDCWKSLQQPEYSKGSLTCRWWQRPAKCTPSSASFPKTLSSKEP